MIEIYNNSIGLHLPVRFVTAVATSDLHVWMYRLRPLHGVMRFLHLLGMAGFLGMILLIEVKSLGFFREASLKDARLPMIRLMNTAFLITILSGIGLFIYDPIGTGLHTMFVPKLILVTLGLCHARWVQRTSAVKDSAKLKRISAAVALVIWVLVIGCSTWNFIEQPLNPADVHRLDPQG
ncbi:MAG TPA: hypothetical protein VFR09_07990 [Alphaproteobacteria bacterium]|nr:hypothetical protein [Alphaproteobacteria bacterium]